MIDIWVDGRSFGPKGSGFGVRLQCGEHDWVRTVQCGSITTNQAELKGVEYALKSIKPEFEEDPVLIRTSNKYAHMMLERAEDGQWVKKAVSNTELVDEVRNHFSRFKEITIMPAPEDDVMMMLKQITEKSLKKGTPIFDKK